MSRPIATSSQPFGCHVYREVGDRGVLLDLAGEFDLAAAPAVDRALCALEAQEPDLIVVCLRTLSFMDVAGLRVLLRAGARRHGGRARLMIVPGGPQPTRLCEVAGAEEELRLVDRVPTGRWLAAPVPDAVRRPADFDDEDAA